MCWDEGVVGNQGDQEMVGDARLLSLPLPRQKKKRLRLRILAFAYDLKFARLLSVPFLPHQSKPNRPLTVVLECVGQFVLNSMCSGFTREPPPPLPTKQSDLL